jgi:hypothetical protein
MTSEAANTDPVAALVARVPEGWTAVLYMGRTYGLSRTTRANGRSVAVLARELGGQDEVSANIFLTSNGPHLRSCEMPDAKVLNFLANWEQVPIGHRHSGKGPTVRESASLHVSSPDSIRPW